MTGVAAFLLLEIMGNGLPVDNELEFEQGIPVWILANYGFDALFEEAHEENPLNSV